jgi:hypothetical protein
VRELATRDASASSNEPGPRTQARIAAAKRRTSARPIRPEVKVVSHEGQKAHIEPVHADSEGHGFHFLDAFGTSSQPFAEAMLGQLASVVRSKSDGVEEASLNAGLASVDGIAPQNEAEAMLAVQMAGTHSVAMEMLRRAKFATSTPALQEYGNLATKLMRTYTAQMECLAKVRRRGEQKVTVEHVHVYPGGQAVVGNVTQTGNREGAGAESEHQAYGLTGFSGLEYAPGTAMWSATRAGTPCQSPAVGGKKRCHKHGGAKGSGAPEGSANGNYRHGMRSRDHLVTRRLIREMIQGARDLAEML